MEHINKRGQNFGRLVGVYRFIKEIFRNHVIRKEICARRKVVVQWLSPV